jgi:broad specificity phosphatase PhoE
VVLVLLRHGQTAWNAEQRFLGRSDVPLDAVGLAQARRLAAALPGPLAASYSSPLSRALETARAVAPDPVVLDDLAELNQGELEGLDGPTAFARYPEFFAAWADDPATARVPGGETLESLQARAVRTIDAIADRHEPGDVVGVFTHQMVIATVSCAILGDPLAAWRQHRVQNAGLTAIAWGPGGWEVVVQRVDLAAEPDHA